MSRNRNALNGIASEDSVMYGGRAGGGREAVQILDLRRKGNIHRQKGRGSWPEM